MYLYDGYGRTAANANGITNIFVRCLWSIQILIFFRALGKLVANKPQSWDQYLDAVMFGLRTKKQITTKFFPFMLMIGREARYLTQVPEHFMVSRHMSQYNFMSIDAVLKTWAERI